MQNVMNKNTFILIKTNKYFYIKIQIKEICEKTIITEWKQIIIKLFDKKHSNINKMFEINIPEMFESIVPSNYVRH